MFNHQPAPPSPPPPIPNNNNNNSNSSTLYHAYYQQQQFQLRQSQSCFNLQNVSANANVNRLNANAQQAMQRNGNIAAAATLAALPQMHSQMRPRSISQPSMPPYAYNSQACGQVAANSNNALVLAAMNGSGQNLSAMSNIGTHTLVAQQAQQAFLQHDFSGYSQQQLQYVLASYPPWLQKECLRRLQRQWDDMHAVEDPQIHHWSTICPRRPLDDDADKHDDKTREEKEKEKEEEKERDSMHQMSSGVLHLLSDNEMDGGRSTCEYLSAESVGTRSPSPFYSPCHHKQATCSPSQNLPQLATQLQAASSIVSNVSTAASRTCFQILDFISNESGDDKDDDQDREHSHSIEWEQDDKFAIVEDAPVTPREHAPPPVNPQPQQQQQVPVPVTAAAPQVQPQQVASQQANVYYAQQQQQQQQQQYQQALQQWYATRQKQQQYQQMLLQRQQQQLAMQRMVQQQQQQQQQLMQQQQQQYMASQARRSCALQNQTQFVHAHQMLANNNNKNIARGGSTTSTSTQSQRPAVPVAVPAAAAAAMYSRHAPARACPVYPAVYEQSTQQRFRA